MSGALYRAVIEGCTDGLIVIDQGGVIRLMNPAAQALLGGQGSARVGELFAYPAEDASILEIVRDGATRSIEMLVSSLEDQRTLITLRDITEHQRAAERENQRLRDLAYLSQIALQLVNLPPEEDLYQAIAEQLRKFVGPSIVSVSIYHKANHTIRVMAVASGDHFHGKFVEMMGRPVIGLTVPLNEKATVSISAGKIVEIEGRVYEATLGQIPEAICTAFERMVGVTKVYGIGFKGEGNVLGVACILLRGGQRIENESIVEMFVNQVSLAMQRRQAEEELRRLSIRDDLTRLLNRHGFFEFAEREMASARQHRQRMVLLFADMDNLKWVNDRFGHVMGDHALIEMAGILQETFPAMKGIARVGGDEFVVFGPLATSDVPEQLVERLQERLDARNAVSKAPYPLTFSVGIACTDPALSCTVDELLALADQAMYDRKHQAISICTNNSH